MTTQGFRANRVRRSRVASGLTQAQLAQQAGVSRPAISAIEADRLVPSVRTALAIARVLNVDVVALFGDTEMASTPVWAWDPPSRPWRVHLSEIRGGLIKIPVESIEYSMWAHDAVEADSALDSRCIDLAKRTLVFATCDPAAPLFASMCWQRKQVRVLPIMRSSAEALDLLASGKVHATGVHMSCNSEPAGNATLAAERLDGEFRLVRGAEWTEGIAVGPGIPASSVSQLTKKTVRWVGREPGSGARRRLDELLGPRRHFAVVAHNHRGVAEMIRSGVADAGICVQIAGIERGLKFIPLQTESYDVCIPSDLMADPRIQALIEVLRTPEYRSVIGDVPGYSTSAAGELH